MHILFFPYINWFVCPMFAAYFAALVWSLWYGACGCFLLYSNMCAKNCHKKYAISAGLETRNQYQWADSSSHESVAECVTLHQCLRVGNASSLCYLEVFHCVHISSYSFLFFEKVTNLTLIMKYLNITQIMPSLQLLFIFVLTLSIVSVCYGLVW